MNLHSKALGLQNKTQNKTGDVQYLMTLHGNAIHEAESIRNHTERDYNPQRRARIDEKACILISHTQYSKSGKSFVIAISANRGKYLFN